MGRERKWKARKRQESFSSSSSQTLIGKKKSKRKKERKKEKEEDFGGKWKSIFPWETISKLFNTFHSMLLLLMDVTPFGSITHLYHLLQRLTIRVIVVCLCSTRNSHTLKAFICNIFQHDNITSCCYQNVLIFMTHLRPMSQHYLVMFQCCFDYYKYNRSVTVKAHH